jgi:hypothetical protein
MMEQNNVTFGTGEVDLRPYDDKLWDKKMGLFGTGEVDLGS